MPSNALYRVPDTTLNALSGPPTVLGMNPLVNRLALIPRYSRQEGVVMPQWVYDMARAAQAPGNALMGHQTTPEEALNFAGNVSLGSYGTSAMMRDAAPGPGKTVAATVYHGSPHKFDAFDMSKIGTGEGAQAYGHGLYVAENKGVAEQYRQALSTYKTTLNGQPLTPDHPQFSAAMAIGSKGYDAALKQAEDAKRLGIITPDFADKEIANIKALKGADIKSWKEGHVYTADLPDSAISKMLDWDKPLSQQPESVRQALGPRLGTEFADQPVGATLARAYRNPHFAGDLLGVDQASPQDLSRGLAAMGIPGIRYLDNSSRATGSGTRNFVVFDDNLLKILNKE